MFRQLTYFYPETLNSQPEDERGSESLHSECGSDEDWDTDHPGPSGSQSFHRERSGSSDSGHGSDNNAKSDTTSTSHSVPKTKPPLSPKPTNKPEAPPATTLLSIEKRCGMFGGMATKFERPLLVK